MGTVNTMMESSFDDKFMVDSLQNNTRIQKVTIKKQAIDEFRQRVFAEWDLQAIEYKPFLRFAIADLLDEICDRQLAFILSDILKDRARGAFVFEYEGVDPTKDDKDFYVLLSTAVSHLVGLPNFDSMYGKFYARFTVKNTESSDSYLRQAYHRMELHNDGTYVDERTDFVLMLKMHEEHMKGGETLLLHIDDWRDLDKYYQHDLAKKAMPWGSPKSKNVITKVSHPVFFEEDENGKPHMLFIDQFAEPQNKEEGLYLYAMSQSLERETNTTSLELPVGSMVVIHNHRWLHGRDKFQEHSDLKRELLRQRGHFTD